MNHVQIGQIAFLAVANTPLYLVLGKVMFGDWSGFLEAVKFWLKPDIISMFDGTYGNDIVAEFKLGLFLAICGGAVYGEFLLVARLTGH